MADRVFPLASDREELHKRGFSTRPTTTYALPPAYDRERKRSCFRCSCCCYICAVLATFFLLLLILGGALYLLLQPKAPTFSITRAHITQFTLIAEHERSPSKSATQALRLQSNVNFTVVAANANKKIGFHYEQITVELAYGGEEAQQVIGRGVLPAALYVRPRGKEEVELQVKGEDILLRERVGLDLQQIVQERTASTSNGVMMHVDALARLRAQVWGFRSRNVHVRIRCDVHMSRPLSHTDAHILSKACKLKSFTL